MAVIPEAVILRGLGSVRPNDPPLLSVPDELLFATGCPNALSRASFTIRNLGIAPLHLCPLAIRPAADGDLATSALFRVVSPRSLRPAGGGTSLGHLDSVEVTLEIDALAGSRYTARLDIPNNVATRTIDLIGDLRSAELGPLPEEAVMERTDFPLCHRGFPIARPILRGIRLTNEGEGHMQVCRVRFLPDNPDGVFSTELPGVFAREGIVRITFNPGEAGINRDYACTARIETNGGSGDVELRARLERREDGGFGAMSGSFSDAFCGSADWNAARDAGGWLMHPPELAEVLTLLGGVGCCPPPHGPDCLCVDLLALSIRDVPPNAGIELVGQGGDTVAESFGGGRDRALVAPFRGAGGYSLRAQFPSSASAGRFSRVQMRRILWQQDGLYESPSTLRGVAVVGNHAYAPASDGLHIIRLEDVLLPVRAALISKLANASAAAACGQHLALLREGLQLYSLADPLKPCVAGSLTFDSAVQCLLSWDRWCAVAGGSRLSIIDISNPASPKQVTSVPTQIQAQAMTLEGKLLLLAGKGGVQIFDAGKPHRPTALTAFATDSMIVNLIGLGSFLLAIRDNRTADLWDIRRPTSPQRSASWHFESWFVPFVPLAGGTGRFRDYTLLLTGDQKGIRLMRPRANAVNWEALRKRRDQLR